MAGNVYFDEDGRKHDHDPNSCTTDFTCSQGHRWQETVSACGGCTSCFPFGSRTEAPIVRHLADARPMHYALPGGRTAVFFIHPTQEELNALYGQ